MFFFFFFQAEDGIRDTSVTGVQTCALPISGQRKHLRAERSPWCSARLPLPLPRPARLRISERIVRSEERRVGKECRSRWATYEAKKKNQRARWRTMENGGRKMREKQSDTRN